MKPSSGTGAALGLLAVLHVAWGLGSPFPFRERDELADAVIGSVSVPSRTACLGVAALLAIASGTVTKAIPMPSSLRRPALTIMILVFALRSALGFSAKTSLLSPASVSPRFQRLDRRYFAPLCLALALGSWAARTQVK
jgi:hypothetical protein